MKGYGQTKGESRTCQEVAFDNMTKQLQEDYLDRYEGVQAEIHQVSQFDESITVSTTYLGKVEISREDALKVQEQFSHTDQSKTMGTSLYGTDSKILLYSGSTKSFMSKQCYLRNKSMPGLPKFSSKAKVTQVGNGASANILFIIPIIIATQGHMFEIYTMVSEIHSGPGITVLLPW